MTFVWKTTCRRLQSSGGLARFAEGHAAEREIREIETHLAACPSCQAIVADTLAVSELLKSSVPAAPAKSLAASGNLWKTLEAEIAQTPQDRTFVQRLPVPEPVPAPRLQRFGRWLATPGAMPFGAVAAAAVVVMVGGTVAYQRGLFPAEKQMASVTTANTANTAVGDSEFTLLPSPSAPAPASMAAGAAAKVTGASRQPSARGGAAVALAPRAADATTADVLDNEIAPIKTKPSALRSSLRLTPAPLPLSAAAPSAPDFRMAKAAPTGFAAASAAAFSDPAGPAQVAEAATSAAAPGGFGGGSPAGVDPLLSNNADNTALPSSAAMARSTAVPVPAPAPAAIVRGSVASAALPGTNENVSGELQDMPASRSLLDIALRQRRQRSLFSYATR